ncbi:hypothetical protein BH09PAT3_BH09PAT3_3970 [soil metagenome]
MPEEKQSPTPSFSRPSARVASAPMPVQRGNYGIPARQITQPQPPAPKPVAQAAPPIQQPVTQSSSRFMDVTAPPARPAPIQQPPAAATPVAPATPPPLEKPLVSQPPRPLFVTAPHPSHSIEEKSNKGHSVLPKVRLGLLVLAVLLSIGGLGRWATAGSTANDIIAVGAVAANDGKTMTIQFTANDGLMHKFTEKSNGKMIPGTAVELAYRSGAPEASVRQVAVVKSAHDLGVGLFMLGVLLFAAAGIITLVLRHRAKVLRSRAPLTTPVTA